jgi:hypothetical protein
MVIVIIVAALLLVMGIVILIGKGDKLIAGYNTASEEEKSQYNVKRLRYLIGGFLIVLAPIVFLLSNGTLAATGYFLTFTIISCIVVIFLANTWAKKK